VTTPNGPAYRRIATEEAFAPPEILDRYRDLLRDQCVADEVRELDALPVPPSELAAFYETTAVELFGLHR
jgi:hypothetical protein